MIYLLIECPHSVVFGWNCHALEIIWVPCGLEVSTDDEKVHLDGADLLDMLNASIDSIKFTMTTSFHSYEHCELLEEIHIPSGRHQFVFTRNI